MTAGDPVFKDYNRILARHSNFVFRSVLDALRMLEDDTLTRRLAESARRRVQQHFSMEVKIAELFDCS